MEKSWMRTNRTKNPYIDGVAAFLKYVVHQLKVLRNMDPLKNHEKIKIPCPCVFCLNHYSLDVDELHHHLFSKGIDESYIKWTKHGEKDERPRSGHINVNDETEIPTDAPVTIEMVQSTEDYCIENHKKSDLKMLKATIQRMSQLYQVVCNS
ncbi:LOW QUALITY PROTEIN: hypothetical protein OSB04_019358 [Centaurea solstitialis]|uniref:Transposase-associated domain-containing protein n=1 Tax=Centaurea solstitialis TaxID=347529 RepID=A0AA38WCB2_9ASTR|nr:LOW QUALITY PROTEIN: hypothetical protein OSB04_019358 [Centaurea solstitialis]